MINHEQVTVANRVGAILRLSLTMTVRGVAGNTAVTQPCRSETLTGSLLKRVEVFKEVFTSDEVGRTISPGNKVHGRCIG